MVDSHESWLTCVAAPGQFSSECAVRANDFQGREHAFFVNRDEVKLESPLGENDSACAKVCVEVLEVRGELALILMPGESLGEGPAITVPSRALVDSAGQNGGLSRA